MTTPTATAATPNQNAPGCSYLIAETLAFDLPLIAVVAMSTFPFRPMDPDRVPRARASPRRPWNQTLILHVRPANRQWDRACSPTPMSCEPPHKGSGGEPP